MPDDRSDAKGFAALRDRHQQDADFSEVCVAVRNTETGQELERQAMARVIAPALCHYRG